MLPFYSKVYFYLSEAQRVTQIKNGVPQAPYKRASEGHFIGFASADTQHNILVFDPQNPRTASEPLMRRDYDGIFPTTPSGKLRARTRERAGRSIL